MSAMNLRTDPLEQPSSAQLTRHKTPIPRLQSQAHNPAVVKQRVPIACITVCKRLLRYRSMAIAS
jgi:hypothetical protein